jgi:hypothetical protein
VAVERMLDAMYTVPCGRLWYHGRLNPDDAKGGEGEITS